MIKTILFDMGGVIITLEPDEARRRFERLGLNNAAEMLDVYTQQGIFGDLECGRISDEEFRVELGRLAGRELTWAECQQAWLGYVKEVPQRNLDALMRLREEGYRVVLLSNTNPFMMSWARSNDFDGQGHAVDYYFDHLYTSYEMKLAKPHADIFQKMMDDEQILPQESIFIDDSDRNVATARQLGIHTLCPKNNEDWTADLDRMIRELNS